MNNILMFEHFDRQFQNHAQKLIYLLNNEPITDKNSLYRSSIDYAATYAGQRERCALSTVKDRFFFYNSR